MIYKNRSCDDKLSLIKCVGLLNAARARKPLKEKIKQELSNVCKLILKCAGVTKQNINLLKKAGIVKKSINRLRNETNKLLECLNDKLLKIKITTDNQKKNEKIRILEVLNIQQKITDGYLRIMSDLCKYCENVMGKPPCDYAVAGMGSLARKEITPYSDFEHVILLQDQDNYETNAEYFRWFSVIFHVIILNLQETIVPSLNVNSLNNNDSLLGNWFFDNYTRRGISFDGMMPHACKFPLGRQEPTNNKPWITELIKPVTLMLKYLSSDENLKNGYHLSDILTKTCFVYGDQSVYEQFERGIFDYMQKQTHKEITNEVKKQVDEDLNKFSTRFCLVNLKNKVTDKLNIKEVVYRSLSLFIPALGRIHHISRNSCFDIIAELAKTSKISENAEHKLMFALAIACQTRLAVYMKEKCQKDEVNIQTLLEILDISDVLNFFQIIYCLQCEIAKLLKFTKLYFYSKPQFINITFCYAFDLKQFAFNLLFNFLADDDWEMNTFNFDVCLKILEEQKKLVFSAVSYFSHNLYEHFQSLIFPLLAIRLYVAKFYDEALKFFSAAFNLIQYKNWNVNVLNERMFLNQGNCFVHLQKPENALYYSLQSLKLHHCTVLSEKHAVEANEINGMCFQILANLDRSLSCFENALKIYEKISVDIEKDENIARVLNRIGNCCFNINKYNRSLIHFQKSLTIYESLLFNQIHSKKTVCLTKTEATFAGICGVGFSAVNGSTFCSYIEMYQTTLQDIENKRLAHAKVARNLNEIGRCFLKKKEFVHALMHFEKAVAICLETCLSDVEKNECLAMTFKDIGCCLVKQKQYSECMKKLFSMSPNLHQEGSDVASINIGWCLLKTKKFEHALTYFFQFRDIYKSISHVKPTKLAFLDICCPYCFLQMRHYKSAIDYFKSFCEIYVVVHDNKDDKLNEKIDEIITNCFQHRTDVETSIVQKLFAVPGIRYILFCKQKVVKHTTMVYVCLSECLRQLQRYTEAIDYLNKVLDVSKKHVLDEAAAAILTMIGICLAESKQYKDAIIYFVKALEVFQNSVEDLIESKMAANILQVIAFIYSKMNHFQVAVKYISQAQTIYQCTSYLFLDKQNFSTVATFLNFVGFCMKNMQKYIDALNCFQRCFRILVTTSLDAERDEDVGDILKNMGHCFQCLQRFNEAVDYFDKSLDVFLCLPCKTDAMKNNVQWILKSIGECNEKCKTIRQTY